MFYGTDLSMWNALADAHRVRAAGISYAWVKATEGSTWTDPTFANKVRQLREAGIITGAYCFLRAGSVAAQLALFRQVAGDAGCLDVGALTPMADMEAADVRANANGVVTQFYDGLGVRPLDVYANLDWFRNTLRPTDWGNRDILGHIAHYNGQPGEPAWKYDRAAVHQHTDQGNIDGIPGNADRNATIAGSRFTLADLRIGNVATMPEPVPQAPAPSGSDSWTVRAGDTLSRVASYWGVTVSAAAVANGIANPDLIMVGQVLHKPGNAAAAPMPTPSGQTYLIQPGDTLGGIAVAFGTTVAQLVALNHISNPDRINAGATLQLPGAAAAPARYVEVQAGDTLSGIASRLGYPGGWSALAARNNISNPDRIMPGQRIYY